MPEERVSAMLKAEDVAGTIAWYREAGFDVRDVHPETGDPTWCGFAGTPYFSPPSVRALAEEIEGRIEPGWGPEVRAWGSRELGLRDPTGTS